MPVQTSQFRATDHFILSDSSLFAGLPAQVLQAILCQSVRKRAERNDVVTPQAQASSHVYFILSGGVKVTAKAHDGKELTAEVLGAGDYFGELSVLDGKAENASTIAVVPSIFMAIGKDHFLELVHQHPPLALRLLRRLADRIRLRDGFIEDMRHGGVEARLARRLIVVSGVLRVQPASGLPGKAGNERRAQGNGNTVLRVSQQDLANIVGVTRESVNKQLKAWKRSGLVKLTPGHIEICDPQRLAVLSGG